MEAGGGLFPVWSCLRVDVQSTTYARQFGQLLFWLMIISFQCAAKKNDPPSDGMQTVAINILNVDNHRSLFRL